MFYKIVQNNEIAMIGESNNVPSIGTEITEEKYNQLTALIRTKPSDTLETNIFYPMIQRNIPAEKLHMMKKLSGMYLRYYPNK